MSIIFRVNPVTNATNAVFSFVLFCTPQASYTRGATDEEEHEVRLVTFVFLCITCS